MCIVTDGEYGTVSASLLALPRYASERPVWLYADGRPGEAEFAAVE
jgi:alkanesulfonate monooxygenase SsuD/methylene tetrahydromethanopterin reductase-like flavin-dependent oxidoreductase (luciferase family)